MNSKIDKYLEEGCGRCPYGGTPDCKVLSWTEELEYARRIALDCGLTEELKWGVPCYTYRNGNVVIISAFKEYAAISFFKGVLLKDDENLLQKPGKHSQSARLLKFTSIEEIAAVEAQLKACIFEAMEVEKAGLKVTFKKNPEPIPEELENRFEQDPILKNAFESLTPGRQRGYILYFSAPKQSKTRESRITNSIGKILNGEGLHDKYQRGKKKR